MPEIPFVPMLSAAEAKVLCHTYDVDKDFWFEVAGRSILNGDCSRSHFDTIFAWKTRNRGKSRPEKNESGAIEQALRVVVEEVDRPRRSIGTLIKLSGVGIPVASAIMAAIFPEQFTIIDFRALDALSAEDYSTTSVKKYLDYVEYCTKLADDWDMSLRELDRALWKWSEKCGARLLEPISGRPVTEAKRI
ncbi:hypothetical protein [Bradyrhizobium sp. S69]|uniref:hypothetical protein n=1 Tax=Bradyrhizobium sp. S69 TaxID=1641856 RepID=UPI00131E9526|nr:hypothetical protein [Bradyrhizobium sp. S69]